MLQLVIKEVVLLEVVMPEVVMPEMVIPGHTKELEERDIIHLQGQDHL